MVQIVNEQGVAQFESHIQVAPELVQVLKEPNNKARIKAALKDLKISHRIEEGENNISIAGRTAESRSDATEQIKDIEKAHNDFLDLLCGIQMEKYNKEHPDEQPEHEPSIEEMLEALDELHIQQHFWSFCHWHHHRGGRTS